MIKIRFPILICSICVLSCYNAMAQSVISFSGGTLESSSITLSFTAGEAISGSFSNSSMNLQSGFTNGSDLTSTSNELLVDDLPKVFRLNQNYPNPFNPSTKIAFDLPKSSEIQLEVFNSIGAKVAVLYEGRKPAGSYVVNFNASGLASGMYFYRLTAAGSIISTKKMILIK